jgi:membrane associated rhomboid family serine protease
MSWQSASVLMPTPEVLVAWGAKDPIKFAKGEYWRTFTPMFVHIGLVHFAMNMWALYALSQHVERILGGFHFLLIYLLSGLMGNILSLVYSLAMSAGASSSVFGIMGAGFVMEFVVGRKIAVKMGYPPPRNVYTSLLVINLALGFMIPQIDNSAHIGGLIAGVLFTFALLNLRANSLVVSRPSLGVGILLFLLGAATVGSAYAADPERLFARFNACGSNAQSLAESFHCYSEGIRLKPTEYHIRLARAAILIRAQQWEFARRDLEIAALDPQSHQGLRDLQRDLRSSGVLTLDTFIDDLLEQET